MIGALALGLLFGAAALVAWRALIPAAPPLEPTLRRLQRHDLAQITMEGVAPSRDLSTQLGRRVGRWLSGGLEGLGLDQGRLGTDLRLVGRTVEFHMGQKVLLALFGLLLPPAMSALAALGGVSFGLGFPLIGGVALAVAFFFVPDLTLRSEAADRRMGFHHALGSFLDLVVIGLAGGAGVESALKDAAAVGQGWAFAQLRQALEITRLTGETPWAALGRLGEELNIPELGELAASVSLAGTEGARVRDSLAAKAQP